MANVYPLKELCLNEITDGTHKTPTYSDSGYIFLSSKNVTTEKIDWENVTYIPETLHNELYNRLSPQKDDILLAKNGTTGVAAIVDRDEIFDIYVSLALIRPDPDIVVPRYLLYAINSDTSKRYFNRHLKGIGVPNLHLTHIRETPIRLPSKNEQQRIVEILDKLNDLIFLREQQLAKLDELVKSRFIEMFEEPFDMKPLNSICKFIDYRGKTPEKSNFGIPLITAKNVRENSFSVEPQEFIPIENYKSVMTRGIPKVNDVLFTTEAPLGNVCRIPNIYPLFCVGQRIITMQPSEKVLTSEYLEYALRDKRFQDKMWKKSSGSTVKGIRSKLLEWLTIPVPPYSIQCDFSGFVQQADRQKLTIQQSLDQLEILKKSLMQEYFG